MTTRVGSSSQGFADSRADPHVPVIIPSEVTVVETPEPVPLVDTFVATTAEPPSVSAAYAALGAAALSAAARQASNGAALGSAIATELTLPGSATTQV